jgi:hypothetical protein
MDIKTSLRLATEDHDEYWKTCHRRSHPKDYRLTVCHDVSEELGFNEDTGDDIRRRERMAKARYCE